MVSRHSIYTSAIIDRIDQGSDTSDHHIFGLAVIGAAEEFNRTVDFDPLITMVQADERLGSLFMASQALLSRNKRMLYFHGWPHHYLVSGRAAYLAHCLDADVARVARAGLVHDLGHLVKAGGDARLGKPLINGLLKKTGFDRHERWGTFRLVANGQLGEQHRDETLETACLHDADISAKFDPVYSPHGTHFAFGLETGKSPRQLARAITADQGALAESGIFLTQLATDLWGDAVGPNIERWSEINRRFENGETPIPDLAAIVSERYPQPTSLVA